MDGLGGYKYYLGNIRLSYSDSDGDGHIDVEGLGQDLDGDGVVQETGHRDLRRNREALGIESANDLDAM